MKHLRKIALLLFASLVLLSPALASAKVGGDEMPDCQLEPEMCTELIIQQDEQIAALEAQLEEAGMTPVTKLSVTEETENATSVNVSGSFPEEASPEWQFVVEYRQNAMESAVPYCVEPGPQLWLAKSVQWMESGYTWDQAYGVYSDPTKFVDEVGQQYFFFRDRYANDLAEAKLNAAANGEVAPDWVPTEPYTFIEILQLLDTQYPGCSTGDYA